MIYEYFPTRIWHEKIGTEFNEILLQRAYLLKEKYNGISDNDWECKTFNTLNQEWRLNVSSDNKIEEFLLRVAESVEKFGEELKIDYTGLQLKLTDFWFNISSSKQGQEYHQHPNNHFSFVYYIKTADDCGDTVFQNHNTLFDSLPLPNAPSESNVKFKPVEGELIIFKSNLLHMVEDNLSGEDRITCSGNFILNEIS